MSRYHIVFEQGEGRCRASVVGLPLCWAEDTTYERTRIAIHARLAAELGGADLVLRAGITESMAPSPSWMKRLLRRLAS